MLKKVFFGVFSVVFVLSKSAYASNSGTYAMEMRVDSAYIISNVSLPGSITFPTTINPENTGTTETIGPYQVVAYTSLEGVGIRLTLVNDDTKQHPPGSDQLYLVRNPIPPGGPDQYVRIPYKIEYKPCYNDAFGDPPPAAIELHPDPTGDENKIPSPYDQDWSCAEASGGIPGELTFVRQAMNYLPIAGTYEGSIAIEVGPE